jgi:hypothetical protein
MQRLAGLLVQRLLCLESAELSPANTAVMWNIHIMHVAYPSAAVTDWSARLSAETAVLGGHNTHSRCCYYSLIC